MVEGDKWEMYIPSELAYGERGSPPKIPVRALYYIYSYSSPEGAVVSSLSHLLTREGFARWMLACRAVVRSCLRWK